MRERIVSTLREIEAHYGIEILHAVESGSRVWGFASEDSDWDVRFIYRRPLTWYRGVRERRDVIELPHKYDPLDISGWDLRKALHLLSKSNPPLIEWLHSPIVYQTTDVAEQIKGLAARYFNPRSTVYHYLHMAHGNYRMYLKGDTVRLKKYFYVIRPLLACEYVIMYEKFPPVEFDELCSSTLLSGSEEALDVAAHIEMLLRRKREGDELTEGPRIDVLNTWIEKMLDTFSKIARTAPKPEVTMDDLDELFYVSVT